MKDFVDALNSLDTRVWAIVLVMYGVFSCYINQSQAGLMLVGGGLAIFKPSA